MKQFSLKYTLLTYRLDQIGLPAALWAVFALLIALFNDPGRGFALSRAYLGLVIPLVAGISAAYAILDDPSLELRLTTPMRPARLLLERFCFIFGLQAVFAVLFIGYASLYAVDFSPLGDWLNASFAWIIPTLSLMALGSLSSLAGRQTMVGVFVVGLVWIVELIVRDFLLTGLGSHLFIFLGLFKPEHANLLSSQAFLIFLSVLMLAASIQMLAQQENYL